MTSYHFRVGGLSGGAAGLPAITLPTVDGACALQVRLCVTDAQLLAAACAGLATPATRLAALACRVADQLDAQPSHVLLHRNDGSMIAASLVLSRLGDAIAVPLTFGDAIVVALARQLPIHGDESLAPLVRPTAPAAPDNDAEVVLPPSIAAFLHSLEDSA